MKCDELEEEYLWTNNVKTPSTRMVRAYNADEVDKAIAELKQKLMPCLNGDCILTCEVVEKYGKENAELKAKLEGAKNETNYWCNNLKVFAQKKDSEIAELKQKLESVQASMYCDVVDANMENRRLRRSLWIARAERAKERKYKYETWERNETKKFNRDFDLIAIVSMKARKWRRVEIKCLKKAEEYK